MKRNPILFCLALSWSAAAADKAPRPNLLVVVVDDLRWDDLGNAGHPFSRTPHMDRIAREGARFQNAFATTPLCSPRAPVKIGDLVSCPPERAAF